jgi:hypothetical protein
VSRLSKQCGILNISGPYRPPRPVVRIAYFFICRRCSYVTGNTPMDPHCLLRHSFTLLLALRNIVGFQKQRSDFDIMWHLEGLVRSDVSMEDIASIFGVEISKLIKSLTVGWQYEGDTFHRNVRSYKTHTAPHPRRRQHFLQALNLYSNFMICFFKAKALHNPILFSIHMSIPYCIFQHTCVHKSIIVLQEFNVCR